MFSLWSVFDFSAGPSARGRQLYCRSCNFKNVSAMLAGNFYTCCTGSYGLLMHAGPTRFYSNDIHLVIIQSNIRLRCVPWYLEMAKLYQLVHYKQCKFFIIILMVKSSTDDSFSSFYKCLKLVLISSESLFTLSQTVMLSIVLTPKTNLFSVSLAIKNCFCWTNSII